MSGFGGAIKLSGESEYKRALAQINQSLRETSSEMKAVTSSYDANDKSLAKLSAQEEVLNKKMSEQEQKLNILKTAYSDMESEYNSNTQKHNDLVKSYNDEKAKLEEIGRTLGTTSKEYQEQEKKVDDLAQEVTKSTKAQEDNEKSMSKMRQQINEAQTDCNKTAKELDNLGKEAKESGKEAEEGGQGFTVLKGVLANLGTMAITTAINGIKNLGSALVSVGKQAIDNYAQYEQLKGGVETLFTPPEGLNEYVTKMNEVGVSTEEAVRKFSAGSEKIMQNAQNAYKTAGLSANQYMETVTGFSASLLQGLDGDTEKSAQYADKAIKDMSDNANKMGTSMESIQNAYQGFAKGNFTMLDNLKLGYSGTKTEMLRLVKDAGVVDETVKSIDDVSFDQMIEAIHIVQENMGITGTTAKEASTTIEGSVNTMKASWSNLLTGIADDNQDFGQLVDNFVESLMAVASNMLPRIQKVMEGLGQLVTELVSVLLPEIITMINDNSEQMIESATNLITALGDGILQALPILAPIVFEIITNLITNLVSALPQIIDIGMQILIQLINGLTVALPQLITMLPTIIKTTVQVLMKNLPLILQAGMQLVVALIQGLMTALPQLISYLPEIIDTICKTLTNSGMLMMLVESSITVMGALVNGLIKALPQLVSAVPQIIKTLVSTMISLTGQIIVAGARLLQACVEGIKNNIPKIKTVAKEVGTTILDALGEFGDKVVSVGADIVTGLWQGITDKASWLKDKIKGWVGDVTSFLKKMFKIGSPSKLMADEVGQWLAKGIGQGFEDNMDDVASQMADSIPTSFDISSPTVSGSNATTNVYDNMVGAFKQALAEMKIELDGEVAGAFVDSTVSRLIYT
ncbi:MAG: hypothetical protein J6Y78_14995 [Paludibacteraceae bacterium]|nr:hypothetical protein [Paludibacteraceae bacterium]